MDSRLILWPRIIDIDMRCLTVLLAFGWLLMMPRLLDKDVKTFGATEALFRAMERPVSEWEHVKSFDSAKDCEAQILQFRENAHRLASDRTINPASFATEVAPPAFSRCIPSDAIQIK